MQAGDEVKNRIKMRKIRILWTDDEVEALKPHIFFLEKKGMRLIPVQMEMIQLILSDRIRYDLIFLDENMPGLKRY